MVIFWGTFFPLISEAITGEKSSLGSPWFDRYTAPLAILLVLFTGIGPLLAWRRVSAGSLWKMVRAPLAVAVVATIAVAAALPTPSTIRWRWRCSRSRSSRSRRCVAEFYRGAAAQRALSGGGFLGALGRVVARNRRRYGGYIVHAGFALLLIAVAASSSFQTSEDLRLMPGKSAQVGDYTVTYVRPTQSIDPKEQKLVFGAVLDITRDGKQVTTPAPGARLLLEHHAATPRSPASSRARRRARSGAERPPPATSGPRCAPT